MIFIKKEKEINTALEILKKIPEFNSQFNENEFIKRLKKEPVILVAYYNSVPAGCKIGYNRYHNNIYYSWLGGVIPEFRRKNIARMLTEKMEKIAKTKGFEFIQFKTQNKFKPMLLLALKNDYQIVDIIKKENNREHRIILQKKHK